MAKETLEQIVGDWLSAKGYFIQYNVKYRPSTEHAEYNRKKDAVHSDIDVLGINPKKTGSEKVMAVSCKSYHDGFDPGWWLNLLETDPSHKAANKEAWQHFRELVKPKWSDAFKKAVLEASGSNEFTHVTAVTVINGNKDIWGASEMFSQALNGNKILLVSLADIVADVLQSITTKTPSVSDFGRTLQLLRAAGYDLNIQEIQS